MSAPSLALVWYKQRENTLIHLQLRSCNKMDLLCPADGSTGSVCHLPFTPPCVLPICLLNSQQTTVPLGVAWCRATRAR
eukprot:365679-Chlamydomonas_euryale.AAC.20